MTGVQYVIKDVISLISRDQMIKGMHALLKVNVNVILETMRSLGGYEAKLLCEWED